MNKKLKDIKPEDLLNAAGQNLAKADKAAKGTHIHKMIFPIIVAVSQIIMYLFKRDFAKATPQMSEEERHG